MRKIARKRPSVNVATAAFSAIYRRCFEICLTSIDRPFYKSFSSPFSAGLLVATVIYLLVLASVNAPTWVVCARLFCFPQQTSLRRGLYRETDVLGFVIPDRRYLQGCASHNEAFDRVTRHANSCKNCVTLMQSPFSQCTNMHNEAANLLRSTAQLLTPH